MQAHPVAYYVNEDEVAGTKPAQIILILANTVHKDKDEYTTNIIGPFNKVGLKSNYLKVITINGTRTKKELRPSSNSHIWKTSHMGGAVPMLMFKPLL
jgi:hypothetical protein